MATKHLRRNRQIQDGETLITPADSLTAAQVTLAHKLGVPVVDSDGKRVSAPEAGGDE